MEPTLSIHLATVKKTLIMAQNESRFLLDKGESLEPLRLENIGAHGFQIYGNRW